MARSASLAWPPRNGSELVATSVRIADHAANIAEDVVFLVEGEIIRHHPEAIQEIVS